MNKIKFISLAAAMAAMAFTFSCSSDDGDNDVSSSSGGGNSSSSSSDVEQSSSSSSIVVSSSSLTYQGQTYKTVTIGDQTWMAENLNYNTPGNKSKCYDNVPSNCTEYGRLYDWATAMALDPSCNLDTCSDQIQEKHQGICPDGWHIPSNDDWDILVDNAGGFEVAGFTLKAENGFSALPGGSGSSDDSYYYFDDVGSKGNWWSASESDDWARSREMRYDDENFDEGFSSKTFLYSVRCLKD